MYNQNIYDVDHIFPRSKVKDDSLDNRVLVKKQVNAHKDNTYPLDSSIREKMKGFWHLLMDKGLISKKKYERLTMPQPTKAIISNEQKSGIRKGSNRASTGKVGALLLSVYIV